MSTKKLVSVGVRNESWSFPAKAAGLSLACLLLSGIVHATPITSVGATQLQDSKQLAARATLARTKVALGPAADAVLMLHPNSAVYARSTAVCILSSDCSSTVEVPEPQSLVLVGSGLLAMAGLIRRRLLQ